MLRRFSDNYFGPCTIGISGSIGIDFKIRTVGIDGKRVKMQIWDTAGQERFRTITTAYYRGAMGIVMCYDISDEVSFFNLRNWMRSVEQHADENTQLILVGCKCDLGGERQVARERGQAFADEFDILFIETSAKTNMYVDDAFMTLASDAVTQRIEYEKTNPRIKIRIDHPTSTPHGCGTCIG